MYSEDDYIMISALQHYVFCRRQCALIHLEQIWQENYFTTSGKILHAKVHSSKPEKRRDKKATYCLPVSSKTLGLTGKTDTVEYLADGSIQIIEMKRGGPKQQDMDEVQLCAQGMCLAEMLHKPVERGYLFYAKNRRRVKVDFTEELKARVASLVKEIHTFFDAGETPPPLKNKKCTSCSLVDYCIPELENKTQNVDKYIRKMAFKDEN